MIFKKISSDEGFSWAENYAGKLHQKVCRFFNQAALSAVIIGIVPNAIGCIARIS